MARSIRLAGGLIAQVGTYEGIPTATGYDLRHGVTHVVVASVTTREELVREMQWWNARAAS
jgi:hypothetical protein